MVSFDVATIAEPIAAGDVLTLTRDGHGKATARPVRDGEPGNATATTDMIPGQLGTIRYEHGGATIGLGQ